MKKAILLAGLLMASSAVADVSTRSDGQVAWVYDDGKVYFCMMEKQANGSIGPICYEAKMVDRT